MHLDLTIAQWAADGLLTVFFFVVGLELKHEFVAGALRRAHDAAIPVLAAIGGVLAPAGIYLAINTTWAGGAPTAGPFPRPPTSRSP